MNEYRNESDPVPKPEVKHDMRRNDNSMSNQPLVTVKVAVDQSLADGPTKALATLLSPSVKDQVFKRRSEFELAGYGISKSGGYRPVIEKNAEGERKLVAYELDFKFTPPV